MDNFISHYVQIKLATCPQMYLGYINFISHYVQIKLTASRNSAVWKGEFFISHYVQIKPQKKIRVPGQRKLYIPLRSDKTVSLLPWYHITQAFISHYVQIKLQWKLYPIGLCLFLYIPLRSDKTAQKKISVPGQRKLYIPLRSDKTVKANLRMDIFKPLYIPLRSDKTQ